MSMHILSHSVIVLDQRGRTAASDELRSRIKESVLRSSEALSPTRHPSRLTTPRVNVPNIGSNNVKKKARKLPQDDDTPQEWSDVKSSLESEDDEEEFAEDEGGGDSIDRWAPVD